MVGLDFTRARHGGGRLFSWWRIYWNGDRWTPLITMVWRYSGGYAFRPGHHFDDGGIELLQDRNAR